MSKNILVAVAWPYASGSRHLGHIGGAYLPADIFARYNRMIGNNVIMVSGSDVHGSRGLGDVYKRQVFKRMMQKRISFYQIDMLRASVQNVIIKRLEVTNVIVVE